ncbi:MAG: heavy metal-associated domain-containing protein [Pseudomonadota bacterium]
MWIKFRFLAVALLFIALPAQSKDYVIQVDGIVCEFCSFGVTKKLSKLPFINDAKYNKGVLVDAENQLVTVAIRPDTALDQAALYSAIEDGGYNPVAIWELNEAGERIAHQP